MHLYQWKIYLSASILMAAGGALAQTNLPVEQLKMPQCLASHLPSNYRILAHNQQFSIVEVPQADLDSITLMADKVHCGRFINLTDQFNGLQAESIAKQAGKLLAKKPQAPEPTANYAIEHQGEVNAALALVNPANIHDTLTTMTAYYNRSASSQTGEDTAHWLKFSFDHMAAEYGREQDVASYFVKTGDRYKQPSVVTVIGKDIKAPAVVIGAHMDTLDGRMPGAGDDGSGSSSVMEIARVLLAGKPLNHPVYIIWYAAEERGLVGSHYVVKDFIKKAIPVKAVIQFDMTGYRSNPEDSTMWVYKDYTDKELSKFLAELIKFYIKVPVDYSRCGYGCSDHASWSDEGYTAAFPCESSFDDVNPNIHTKYDEMSKLSLDHMSNFARLGIAFAIELAS